MTPISMKSCIAQIEAPALPERTPREQRIRRISELTRAIARAEREARQYEQAGKPSQVHRDFIARKVAERDRLMLETDEGDALSPTDPNVTKYLGTLESRAEVEALIESFAPEFTAPLPEAMPETQDPAGDYF